MKILHVCLSRSWGGLEKNGFDLALAQMRAGHEILFACRKGFTIEAELGKAGVPCLAFGHIIAYADLRIIFAIRRLLTGGGFQIVHATHSEDLGLIFPAVMMAPNARFFFTLQMNVPGLKTDFYHRWEYATISKVIVSSPVLRDAARQFLPVKEGQVIVIPYGLDTALYRPARDEGFRRSIGYAPDELVLGILGRLDPPKGQMEAIRAMPIILSKYPNARLLLVGNESIDHKGREEKRLKDEIALLGLRNYIRFMGDQRGKAQAKALNAMDVFLLPSHFETHSTSAMMAEIAAVPIVGTNSGGTPAQLGFGKWGELVEPKNPASLAQGILTVLDKLDASRERARRHSAEAAQRYEMKNVLSIIETEYRNALASPR